MTNNVTKDSFLDTPPSSSQKAVFPPTNGGRFSYMPPWSGMPPKITALIPTLSSAKPPTASLSSRISTSPTLKELTTQNYPQYWQKDKAPAFERLFPKIFAAYSDVQLTQQHLLSEDPVKKSSGALTLVDYLSAPPMQGLKNENAVFYFLDCLQLAISLNKIMLLPLLSETVGESLQKFLFKAFLAIDARFHPQVIEFLNLNDSAGFAPAKEKILAHCKALVSPVTIVTSEDQEVLLQHNKRPRLEPTLAAASSNSDSITHIPSGSVPIFLERINKIANSATLNSLLRKHNPTKTYRSYILDQFAQWVPKSELKSSAFNELSSKTQIFNNALLFLAHSEPKLFREVVLTGFFEANPKTIPTRTPPAIELKAKAYGLIAEFAPTFINKFPLYRNTWWDLPEESLPTNRVGRNPFLEQNFISVQTLLYYTGHEIKDQIAQHDPTFLERLTNKNPHAISVFLQFLAYKLVCRGVNNPENTELAIMLKLPTNRKLIVYVNHDTFDLINGDLNQRVYPNEPNLIKILLSSIHIKCGCGFFDYPTWQMKIQSSEEKYAAPLKLLIQGMANGMLARYFDPNPMKRPCKPIFQLSNSPLMNLLNGLPRDTPTEMLYEWTNNKKNS